MNQRFLVNKVIALLIKGWSNSGGSEFKVCYAVTRISI